MTETHKMLGPDGLVHDVHAPKGMRIWDPPHVVDFYLAKRLPDDTPPTCMVCIRWRKDSDG